MLYEYLIMFLLVPLWCLGLRSSLAKDNKSKANIYGNINAFVLSGCAFIAPC